MTTLYRSQLWRHILPHLYSIQYSIILWDSSVLIRYQSSSRWFYSLTLRALWLFKFFQLDSKLTFSSQTQRVLSFKLHHVLSRRSPQRWLAIRHGRHRHQNSQRCRKTKPHPICSSTWPDYWYSRRSQQPRCKWFGRSGRQSDWYQQSIPSHLNFFHTKIVQFPKSRLTFRDTEHTGHGSHRRRPDWNRWHFTSRSWKQAFTLWTQRGSEQGAREVR